MKKQIKKKYNWIKYIIYFVIFSFVGSFIELLSRLNGGKGVAYDKAIYQFFNIKL